MGLGEYYQLTIDGTLADAEVVTDIRGNILDGEFTGTYPSGDGRVDTVADPDLDNDFVWGAFLGDFADDFDEAVAAGPITLTLDGGTVVTASAFDATDDVDIFGFSGNAFDYFAAEFDGPFALMALFLQDDQGTVDTSDDFFEAVARSEDMWPSTDAIFQAFELPETGDYFLAVAADWATGTYQLEMTLSSSDTNLVADLGGALPADEEIAYVSNNVGDNNNNLGANNPKQLIYLDFDGGTANANFSNVTVEAFDSSLLDAALAGMENTLINGDGGSVIGIVDNVVSIFQNTAPSYLPNPPGALVVNFIDVSNPADWAAYTSDTEGLWFTTVDPATAQGLDPDADFNTIFIGQEYVFDGGGAYLGLGTLDYANMDKADNALVFAQNYAHTSYAATTTGKLNEYSRALANTIAHELGHNLGLDHQPTDFFNYTLLADDPDNNDLTADDSNTGVGLMAYAPSFEDVSGLAELGTAELSSDEFPVGWIDTQDLLLRWLA